MKTCWQSAGLKSTQLSNVPFEVLLHIRIGISFSYLLLLTASLFLPSCPSSVGSRGRGCVVLVPGDFKAL